MDGEKNPQRDRQSVSHETTVVPDRDSKIYTYMTEQTKTLRQIERERGGGGAKRQRETETDKHRQTDRDRETDRGSITIAQTELITIVQIC